MSNFFEDNLGMGKFQMIKSLTIGVPHLDREQPGDSDEAWFEIALVILRKCIPYLHELRLTSLTRALSSFVL
jgi:hypothetical protein